MSEVTAIKKFACPACGAEAVWTPSKKALVCPYCSTVSPAELKADGSLVEENDLVVALRIHARGSAWLGCGAQDREMPELPGHFRL
jgi:hypothetical protein